MMIMRVNKDKAVFTYEHDDDDDDGWILLGQNLYAQYLFYIFNNKIQ